MIGVALLCIDCAIVIRQRTQIGQATIFDEVMIVTIAIDWLIKILNVMRIMIWIRNRVNVVCMCE